MARARQVGAGSGILAFISALIASFALGGNQPGATDAVASVQLYITQYESGIYVHHTFLALEFVLILGFAVFLCGVLRSAEEGPAVFSVLAMAGATAAVTTELVVLGLHSATFAPAANTVDLRVLATAVLRELTILELLPWAVFFAAVAVLSLGRRALPSWLGWIAAVLAGLDLFAAIWSGLTGANAVFDVSSFVPAFVLIYFAPRLWMVAASAVLLRRELTNKPATQAAA